MTRYILSTNGTDHTTTYTSKAKALDLAKTYVWAAQRTEKTDTEQSHLIQVRTQTTGKLVFEQLVLVPAKVNDVCGGDAELCSLASKTGRCSCPKPAPVAPQTAVQPLSRPEIVSDPATLDTAELNTDNAIPCGWCERTADRKIHIACQSHPEFACAGHFREYFPHLSNPQMESALCPTVSYGCEHTMAMNDEGYGVACVEFANARGIQWMYA